MSKKEEKKTVRVRRRRRTDQGGTRERAEAPSRRRSGKSSTPRPTSSGGGGSGSGAVRPPSGGIPLGSLGRGMSPRMLLIVGALVVICIVCALVFNIFPGSDGGDLLGPVEQAPQVQQIPEVSPTAAPQELEPFVPPVPATGEGDTWLVMLYQDADDKILEEDIYLDLNEAERIGSSDRVHIVSQVDRYNRGYSADGNWDSTKRFYIQADPDLKRVASQEIMDLGEVNMASGESLVDFVSWAADTFPADKYVLIMSDHGVGWPGGWSDPAPGGQGEHQVALAQVLGDEIFLMELDEALGKIRSETEIDQFELIGMDACLMSHVEVYDALAPHARYAVASQETEPALGWAYTGFLGNLVENPDVSGAELGQWIVDSYINEDQRIVDDQARAEFTGRGSPLSGIMGMLGGVSAQQLTQQMSSDITLSAVDLQAFPKVMDSLNDLAFAMQGIGQPQVAQARNYAQSYTSVFGQNVPPSYLDLGNFAKLVKQQSNDPQIGSLVDQLVSDIDAAVIAERHGRKKPGSSGLSIYFPNSQLYRSAAAGAQSYTEIASRFASNSLWDDFLAYHYTGRRFEAAQNTLAVPESGAATTAPGSGDIEVTNVTLTSNVAAPGEPILISADVRGNNLGYVYLYTGFLDEANNSVFVADMDYLESPDTREVDGVFYPAWPEGEFTLEFEWEPLMFAINDGQDSALALFSPRDYGATFEEAIYTVDGIYTYADGEQVNAQLYFNNNNGLLNQVYGFTGQDSTGAPREILPQIGDQFTVLESWVDLAPSGQAVQRAVQEGGTLTFGAEPFTWEELDGAPGQYIVGFIFEDLDGNTFPVYGQVEVE